MAIHQRIQKWRKWLEIIHSEVEDLAVKKYVFWEVQALIRGNKHIQKPSVYYEYLATTYATSALITIRRHVKIDVDSISMARLLSEIAADPKLLSIEFFRSLYSGTVVENAADRDFKRFANKASTHVDPRKTLEDLGKLKVLSRKCETFADKRIAHFDSSAPQQIPTYKEIDECIDFFGKLVIKYTLLLRAVWLSRILPAFQYDWKEIFRHPWIIKGN